MSHGYSVLDAVNSYERICIEFSDKCKQVLEGEVFAYYTRYKITESFWLLAAFHKRGDAYLNCALYRGTYKGVAHGHKTSCKDKVSVKPFATKSLGLALLEFPELKKAKWFDHWPTFEEIENQN